MSQQKKILKEERKRGRVSQRECFTRDNNIIRCLVILILIILDDLQPEEAEQSSVCQRRLSERSGAPIQGMVPPWYNHPLWGVDVRRTPTWRLRDVVRIWEDRYGELWLPLCQMKTGTCGKTIFYDRNRRKYCDPNKCHWTWRNRSQIDLWSEEIMWPPDEARHQRVIYEDFVS